MEILETLAKKENNIFQSDAWADFQAELKRKSWVVKGDNVQGLVVKIPLIKGNLFSGIDSRLRGNDKRRGGNDRRGVDPRTISKRGASKYYFFSPRGPIMTKSAKLQDLKLFLRKVETLAKEENAVFYRIEPYSGIDSRLHGNDMGGRGNDKVFDFRKMAKHAPVSQQFSPENTLVLDISQDEEKILAQMKPKWRYNINLAGRKGIRVREGRNLEDIKIFYKLTKEMEQRGGYYKGHEYDYYKKMFEVLGVQSQKETRLRKKATDGQEGKSKKEKGFLDSSFQEVARNDNDGCVLKLFIAEHEGPAHHSEVRGKQPLAAILVSYFGQVATYLHGASGNEKRELMPTYALQWAAIQEAKRRGCRLYDFWGVAPKDAKNHPWGGISRFKRGFGGEELSFGGAYDLAFEKNYYKLLSTANRFRKIVKR